MKNKLLKTLLFTSVMIGVLIPSLKAHAEEDMPRVGVSNMWVDDKRDPQYQFILGRFNWYASNPNSWFTHPIDYDDGSHREVHYSLNSNKPAPAKTWYAYHPHPMTVPYGGNSTDVKFRGNFAEIAYGNFGIGPYDAKWVGRSFRTRFSGANSYAREVEQTYRGKLYNPKHGKGDFSNKITGGTRNCYEPISSKPYLDNAGYIWVHSGTPVNITSYYVSNLDNLNAFKFTGYNGMGSVEVSLDDQASGVGDERVWIDKNGDQHWSTTDDGKGIWNEPHLRIGNATGYAPNSRIRRNIIDPASIQTSCDLYIDRNGVDTRVDIKGRTLANRENGWDKAFWINTDDDAPDASIPGNIASSYNASSNKFNTNFTVTDGRSGVHDVSVYIDYKDGTRDADATPSNLGGGTYNANLYPTKSKDFRLAVYTRDNVGNSHTYYSGWIQPDRTPPSITWEYNNDRRHITFTVTDTGSGVNSIWIANPWHTNSPHKDERPNGIELPFFDQYICQNQKTQTYKFTVDFSQLCSVWDNDRWDAKMMDWVNDIRVWAKDCAGNEIDHDYMDLPIAQDTWWDNPEYKMTGDGKKYMVVKPRINFMDTQYSHQSQFVEFKDRTTGETHRTNENENINRDWNNSIFGQSEDINFYDNMHSKDHPKVDLQYTNPKSVNIKGVDDPVDTHTFSVGAKTKREGSGVYDTRDYSFRSGNDINFIRIKGLDNSFQKDYKIPWDQSTWVIPSELYTGKYSIEVWSYDKNGNYSGGSYNEFRIVKLQKFKLEITGIKDIRYTNERYPIPVAGAPYGYDKDVNSLPKKGYITNYRLEVSDKDDKSKVNLDSIKYSYGKQGTAGNNLKFYEGKGSNTHVVDKSVDDATFSKGIWKDKYIYAKNYLPVNGIIENFSEDKATSMIEVKVNYLGVDFTFNYDLIDYNLKNTVYDDLEVDKQR